MAEGQGRTPPHSAEAEEGLLGALMMDTGMELLSACFEMGLQPESFFLPVNQVLFQVIRDIGAKNEPVDEVTVLDALTSRTVGDLDWLKRKQRLTDPDTSLLQLVGGPGFITRLGSRIESIANARHWLGIVREKWLLRRLITTTTEIADRAYVNQDQLSHFIDEVEKQILSINEERISDSTIPFDKAIEAANALVNRILSGQSEVEVMTGFKDIDKMTFGLHPGQMIVLAARPSMGKTSLGMNIAEHVALPIKAGQEGKGVLVFSLEMTAEQLAMRMLCGRANVNMRRVRDRMLGNQEQGSLAKAAITLNKAPIWVDDSSGLNILQLRAKARRIHRQHSISLIVIDYLQLINGTDSRVPREQQISEISRGIKGLANDLNVPVMVLSQLNRSSEKENRQPRLSDLRESGSIEQDADIVMLLANRQNSDESFDVPQASRERDLIIAKQRNGPTGSVALTFLPEFTRFENYSPQRDG